ncbi:hypothetical protein BJX96DRAFT_158998 [Aspergillus floccosus]
MAQLTREQAQEIVDEIAQRNGTITDEDRAATPPAVLKALQNVRNQLASQRLLWTPRDEPDVRRDVVFRLISSARSLRYTWAKKEGKEPYFSLDVTPDRMIIDTNDDGCQISDIKQLSEARHNFSNDQTNNLYGAVLSYTCRISGEVRVQSGLFSFALRPQSPGDILGSATPVNREPASLPEGVRSRIILYPLMPRGFEKLVDEFEAIANNGFVLLDPEDVCLPMCKKFVFSTRRALQTRCLTYKVYLRDGISEVTKTHPSLFGSFTLSSMDRFLLYKSTKPGSFDKLVLLFPIDEDSRPIIRSQKAYHIVGSFAFPISDVELNFGVCATVTKCDPVREADIDTSILKKSVIRPFCDAVAFCFCQAPSRTYGWVQYIPQQSIVTTAWHETVQKLLENLRVTPVFQNHKGFLRRLSSLRYLSPEHYGGDNKPLFGDSENEDYLSTRYSAHLDCLRPLGLQEISDHEVLEKLKPLLTNPFRVLPDPTLRKERMSLISRLLITWLKRDPNNTLATEIRNIPFIQLSNGSFVRGKDLSMTRSEADPASAHKDVYFSTDTNGNDIPKCLDISIVPAEAVSDGDQEELFRLLGVRRAYPELVMELISQHSHSTSRELLVDSVHILCYVYDSCDKDSCLKRPCLVVADEHCVGILVCSTSCPRYLPVDVYLKTDGAYGTEVIAKTLASTSISKHCLRLLHPDFLCSHRVGEKHISQDTRTIWLEQQGIVRRVPGLAHCNNPKQLSGIFNAIISHHPDILLGVLRQYWDTYRPEIMEEPLIASAIRKAKVPTLNGLARLDECYFPIPEFCNMVQAVSTTMSINILKLPGSWGLDSEQEWGFLRELGVCGGTAATFIKVIQDRLLSAMTLEDAKPHFFEVYGSISGWTSEESLDDAWQYLDEEEAVYIPNTGDGAKLVHLSECIWSGPSWLRTVHALASHEEYRSDLEVRRLFSDRFGVENADWRTYLVELRHLQEVGVRSIEETRRIYQAIMEDAENVNNWKSLRSHFRQGKLIYVPGSKQWHAPGKCIWTSFPIGDKIGISNIYSDMKSLFVEKLQVEIPSVLDYISHIQHLCKHEGSVAEVIEALRQINNLETTMSDLNGLKDIEFLPIEDTDEEFSWGSVTSDFFIIDREDWPILFYGKVPTLQLHLDEVRELAPLFKSLGLGNRFISICAVKETSVSERPSQSSFQLTNDFRQRSSGLSRCILHYNGSYASAAREIYDTFRRANVYESEHIVGKCTLTSRSGSSTSLQTYSRLHMEYLNGKLSIFVPRDEKERLICYATQLPESIMSSLKIKHPVAYGIFVTVLSGPVEVVDGILATRGIPEIPDLDAVSPVISDDSTSDYEDALEDIFVPKASIAWNWSDEDQFLDSERSERQLVLRSKDTAITEYRPQSDRHDMTVNEHTDG